MINQIRITYRILPQFPLYIYSITYMSQLALLLEADWTSKHSADEIIEALEKASVPAGKIYDAKDMVEDEHINARGMIEDVTVGTQEEGKGWNLKIPGMSPVLETTPGGTKWPGPDLGAHTDQVLKELLSLSEKQLQEYSQTGITGGK
ncbi:hypothetical protein G6F56_010568 [Rhizopus delemar]|nr:hypothetical protein G6F56_010568 [Rhizopus delemar]